MSVFDILYKYLKYLKYINLQTEREVFMAYRSENKKNFNRTDNKRAFTAKRKTGIGISAEILGQKEKSRKPNPNMKKNLGEMMTLRPKTKLSTAKTLLPNF